MPSIAEVFRAVAGEPRSLTRPDFSHQSPGRPPYWRLGAALERCQDPATTTAENALADFVRRPLPDGLAEDCRPDGPALQQAIEIALGEKLRRVEFEARVLADQPAEEIADRLQVSREAVAAYEMCFFDVRTRSTLTWWIRDVVLKLKPFFVLKRTDVPLLWRVFGYRFGVHAVDWLTQSVECKELRCRGVDAYLEPDVPIPAELKFSIACERLPIPKTGKELLRLMALNQLIAAQAAQQSLNADLAGPVNGLALGEQPLVMDNPVIAMAREMIKDAA